MSRMIMNMSMTARTIKMVINFDDQDFMIIACDHINDHQDQIGDYHDYHLSLS